MHFLRKIILILFSANHILRRSILLLFDIIIICFSIWLSSSLLNIEIDPKYYINLILIGISCYLLLGQYKGLTRFVGSSFVYGIAIRNLIIILIISIINLFLKSFQLNLNYFVTLWILLTATSSLFRFILRDTIIYFSTYNSSNKPKAIIYGAGTAGATLLRLLIQNDEYIINGFIDDDPILWGRNIMGFKIYPPSELENLVNKNNVNKVLLAIPSIKEKDYRHIVNFLDLYKVSVLKVPNLSQLLSGRSEINKLLPLNSDDLLDRKILTPDQKLLVKDINRSEILITGAGGSIGSELCRQLIYLNPLKIILLDHSEHNLYSIYEELLSYDIQDIEIIPVLGSATNYNFINKIILENNLHIIFHAAAYKHVPIVELNQLQGLANNVISTRNLCRSALNNSVPYFLLISSDKAVRPSNVMGASKRLSELIVQASHEYLIKSNKNIKDLSTIFSMVRFGNVLDSSGSVIPLFRKQIAAGGPITLTHENITRYFMTIKEAVHLLLQTISLAKGGDVFLLDMGDPIKIKDVAEKMIQLSGLTVKDDKNLNGDIEIVVKGLRPGEKLYEELLIDSQSLKTDHPLIYSAIEKFIPMDELVLKLDELEEAINIQNKDKTFELLSSLVPEWKNSLVKNN